MINVSSTIRIHEVNIQGPVPPAMEHMTVLSHWNEKDLVVLKLPCSPNSYTVNRWDLEAAIQNAANANRFGG